MNVRVLKNMYKVLRPVSYTQLLLSKCWLVVIGINNSIFLIVSISIILSSLIVYVKLIYRKYI